MECPTVRHKYGLICATELLPTHSVCAVVALYEHELKRTYPVMLFQVGIYLPLLVGLIILYPWLAGKYKISYSEDTEDNGEDERWNSKSPKFIE